MADAAMLSRALEQLPEAFSHAGRKYLIAPIEGGGCFHPKIMLRYGKSKARMTLGSANATSAGWGSNRELVSRIKWSESSDSPDGAIHCRLIARAHDWLLARLPASPDTDLAYKLDLLNSQSPWLANTVRGDGVEELADGSLIDLLLSDPGSVSGIGDRFLERIEGGAEQLVIISPYWDVDLAALERLHADLGGPSTHIFLTLADDLEARQSTFPLPELDWGLKPKFHPLGDNGRHRFLHAKLILAQTRRHDYLLYGSANCTTAALGPRRKAGVNCEAAIFRRLPRGTIDEALGLDYSETIRRRDIVAPERPEPSAGTPRFHPGRIERKDDRLFWSVPPAIDPAGAELVIGESRLPLAVAGGMRPHAQIGPSLAAATIVVRVALADGRVSRPVIVVDPDMLMAAAPNPLANNIKRRLDAVLSGASDLIELARDAHLIFGDAQPRRSAGLRSVVSGPSIGAVVGQDFDSPEAFREALGLKADLKAGTFAHADNPALQLLLQIVLRGIVQLEDSESIDRATADSAAALASGERQDDEGDDGDGTPARAEAPQQRVTDAPIPREAFERNRAALERAIIRFEEHIAALATSDGLLDLDFVTRALFMIYLMLYGCSHRYVVEGGEPDVLIPFSAIGTRRQEDGFLLRAARLISRIWGRSFTDGLLARIPLDRELANVPTPILTLVILSRWILAAILTEARTARGAKSFVGILEVQIPQIFRSTSAFALTDEVQVEATVAQMARQIGMSGHQAEEILRTMVRLGSRTTAPEL
ncbi:hypothetical protein HJG53_06205 [Sphingomonas sp. ID1715]|uniref:hypothetical protein n=1 Tax=Sphingomonas sp. ID1715 TaxID=1656898 RepID=UPI0014889A1B|nr:hypothetical protein [Sphingomonas sp. ID1715]NNM76494.1 hypothetical protein [Sphingomonas sp. ID1715]